MKLDRTNRRLGYYLGLPEWLESIGQEGVDYHIRTGPLSYGTDTHVLQEVTFTNPHMETLARIKWP